jgi:serpin B
MRMPLILAAALIAAVGIGAIRIPACGGAAPSATAVRAVSDRVVAANNEFGFDLFHRLRNAGPTSNVVISPASVALALDMVYNGARGTTREAMARTLHLNGITLEGLNRSSAELMAGLRNADPKVQLNIANSLWYRPGMATDRDAVQRLMDTYDAEIGDLTGGAAAVNAWVDKQTHGKIPTIVTVPDVATALAVLANAVYFKGKWSTKFDRALTRDEPFTHLDGGAKPCKMMHQSGNYRYAFVNGIQAVELPYGNGRLAMVILLPDRAIGFSKLAVGLSGAGFAGLIDHMQMADGDIGMPRLHVLYGCDLSYALKALGVAPAFNSQADFSGLFPSGARISKVLHKTYLDSNEEGTEAAAATAVIMASPGPPHSTRFKMLVNHPFVIGLRDTKSGAVLFLGAIVDPS